jgi:O-antigen/teichoic acid export membrane protein
MYMRIFAEDGAEATRRFLKKALHSYCLLGFPIIAGSSAIGAELLVFIASEKYQAGGAVIPFTVAGLIIAGAVRIVSAGLYIQKKSMTSLWLLLTAALLNLILNIILIPIYGITGAALATMLSASIWVSITYFTAKQYFSFPVATKEILIIAINCLLMYLLVQSIQITGPLGMVAKVAVGVISYAALIVATDPVAKKAATELIAKIK